MAVMHWSRSVRFSSASGLKKRSLRWWDDDIDDRAKPLCEQGAGGVSTIGTICDETGHIPINLVKQLG
jgi:hypothetical protein